MPDVKYFPAGFRLPSVHSNSLFLNHAHLSCECVELLKWCGFLQIELPFPYDMVQLDTRQCRLGTGETFEAQHRSRDFLDEAMVGMPHHLLDDVIQILALNYRDEPNKAFPGGQLNTTYWLITIFFDCCV